jgi:hypothetical protein
LGLLRAFGLVFFLAGSPQAFAEDASVSGDSVSQVRHSEFNLSETLDEISSIDWAHYDNRYKWGFEFEIAETNLPRIIDFFDFSNVTVIDSRTKREMYGHIDLFLHTFGQQGPWSHLSKEVKAKVWLMIIEDKGNVPLASHAPPIFQRLTWHFDDEAIEFILDEPTTKITDLWKMLIEFSVLAGVEQKTLSPDPKNTFESQFHIHFDRNHTGEEKLNKSPVGGILYRMSLIYALERAILRDERILNPNKTYSHTSNLFGKGFVRLPEYPKSETHGELRHHLWPLHVELKTLLDLLDLPEADALKILDQRISDLIQENPRRIDDLLYLRPDIGAELFEYLANNQKHRLKRTLPTSPKRMMERFGVSDVTATKAALEACVTLKDETCFSKVLREFANNNPIGLSGLMTRLSVKSTIFSTEQTQDRSDWIVQQILNTLSDNEISKNIIGALILAGAADKTYYRLTVVAFRIVLMARSPESYKYFVNYFLKLKNLPPVILEKYSALLLGSSNSSTSELEESILSLISEQPQISDETLSHLERYVPQARSPKLRSFAIAVLQSFNVCARSLRPAQ